jgi:hypothetical protein
MSEPFIEIRCVFPGVDSRSQDAAVRRQYPLGSEQRKNSEVVFGVDDRLLGSY